ncbi:RHS repeat protein [Sulfidibacter corallicola]|uniref:RHS repeat protein n=1 Tax=Sulfidibacter corallicola TaxID=2818388 RepID=A0A8A4TRI5_SULCO|nr:RHS repeat-associated core domain-containing protein [Sulfidibacter corallicola]QTD52133.1 RHS repeat protein [Sulfidibacter corallicola]
MKPLKGRSPYRKWEFVNHDPNFYKFDVPDVSPTFTYRLSRSENPNSSNHLSFLEAGEYQAMWLHSAAGENALRLQKDLEIQRLEILLCKDPGVVLNYGQQLSLALSHNHDLLSRIASGKERDRRVDAIVVMAGFFHSWLGQLPQSQYLGTERWWRTLEKIRSLGIEIPSEHSHPIPKTGVLSGRLLYQALENMRTGTFFDGTAELLEKGGSSSAGSGGSAGKSSKKAKKSKKPPAPAPAPAPPKASAPAAPSGASIGPNGEIVGNTNPPVEPETKEESSWWDSLKSAVSSVSISDIVHTTLDVVGLVPGLGEVADGLNALIYLAEGNYTDAALSAAAMIPFAGAAATAAKFGRKGMKAAQKAGKAMKKASVPATPPIAKCTTAGCPISVVTGEELLQHEDFVLPGAMPLVWRRTYRSGQSRNRGLGHGWTHPAVESVRFAGEEAILSNDEGRDLFFPVPSVGETVYQEVEQLLLRRPDPHTLILESDGPVRKIYKATTGAYVLSEARDTHGNFVRFHFGLKGRLEEIETSSGRRARVESDERGRITQIHGLDETGQPIGNPLVTYAYDEHDDLVEVVDPLGHSEKYAYRNHVLVERTLKTGFRYHFEWDRYDTAARCLRNWGDDGIYDYRFAWDPERNQSSITDSLGHTTRYRWDAFGNILDIADPSGNRTRFEYDSVGKLRAEIDPLGNRTRFVYDADDRLIEVFDKLGARTHIVYDEEGRPIAHVDPANQERRREYNTEGLPVTSVDADGEKTRFEYDVRGLVTRIVGPSGGSKCFEWNRKGELVGETDADGRVTRYQYDDGGNVVAVVHSDGSRTGFDVDQMGRASQVHLPNGQTLSFEYNEDGMIRRFIDGAGRETRYEYSGLGSVTRRIDPDGSAFAYEYDREQNLVAVVNQNGERYELEYDANERLIREVGFDGRQQRYHYDPAGQLIRHEDGLFRTVAYRRDAMGRVIEKTARHEGTGAGETATFDYDVLGRLSRATNPHRDLRFFHDASNRIIEEWQDDRVLSRRFDASGNCVATQLPNGRTANYDYDPMGRLVGLDLDRRMVGKLTYGTDGLPVSRGFGNGLSAEMIYEPNGRLAQQKVMRPGSVVGDMLFGRDYRYDEAGNLSQIKELASGQATRFTYDAADRLCEVDGLLREVFAFDPAGNLLENGPGESERPTLEGGYVKGNRLLVFQDKKFEYDDVGNLVKRVQGPGGQDVTEFEYDAENRLVRSVRNGTTTHYRYDALGRRVSKQTGSDLTSFLWNGDVLVQEDREGEEVTYLYQPESFLPLGQVRGEDVFYYHLDHLGTPREMTGPDGEVAWAAHFSAYGRVVGFDTERVQNPLRFQGQYFDEETGLHYNYHRYYDPEMGRFVSPDPVGLLGGENLYQYAPNPIGWVDPYGLSCKEAVTGFVKGAASKIKSGVTYTWIRANVAFRGVKTGKGKAVFWSGYHLGNKDAAQAFARSIDGKTVEMTEAGKWMEKNYPWDELTAKVGDDRAKEVWDDISKKFAGGASGDVNAFVKGMKSEPNYMDKTYFAIEKPILQDGMKSGRVSKIIEHD